MDLRTITWSSDQCVSDPEIKLQIEDLSERGLLGPAAACDFELEEGQCVVFVMREVGDYSYANEEHQEFANPTTSKAKAMGVPVEQMFEATNRLRPKENPILTKVGYCNWGSNHG